MLAGVLIALLLLHAVLDKAAVRQAREVVVEGDGLEVPVGRAQIPVQRLQLALVFLGLAGLFLYMLGQMNEGEYNPREVPTQFIGREAPRFELPDLFDPEVKVRSADMAGQVWLLNVWGTWCPECWREHDFLLYLAKQEQFPIVGIDWRDDANEARRFLQQKGNPFIAVGVDTESKAIMDLGVYGAPETFLIDSDLEEDPDLLAIRQQRGAEKGIGDQTGDHQQIGHVPVVVRHRVHAAEAAERIPQHYPSECGCPGDGHVIAYVEGLAGLDDDKGWVVDGGQGKQGDDHRVARFHDVPPW